MRRRVAKKPNQRYKVGELLSLAQAFQMNRSLREYLLPWPRMTWLGLSGALTFSSRRRRSNDGIGIFTGQTSPQAPQSDEALGWSGTLARPTMCGVMILPIGPG
ncbi:hypothetical protein D9M73_237910 [compost metagenome]